MKTHIYLIECRDAEETYYKIGYTKNNVIKRLKQLQTGSSYELRIVYDFETEFGTKLESTLHRMNELKRVRNEWFNLSQTDVLEFWTNCEKIEKNFKILKDSNNVFFK